VSGAGSFEEMNNLPVSLRKDLAVHYQLLSGTVSSELLDKDSTVKLGITMDDGAIIESVILSDEEGRKTACLSTQAGCPVGCVFCKTGHLGFKRNLSASEISGQFLHLRRKEPAISHVVIMGMGEPLLNLDELRKALDFLMDPGGLNISKRRITLSSCGIIEGIYALAEQGPDIRLAISLTTARAELRERLMPLSRENTLPSLKKALVHYQKKIKRRITLELVLLGGINTGTEDSGLIAEFSRGLDTIINLIPWNPVEGLEFDNLPLKRPSHQETATFSAELEKAGLKVTQRYGKGLGIAGACGQLGAV